MAVPYRQSLALLLILALAACGGSAAPAPLPSVAGLWSGTIASPDDGAGAVLMDLSQTGTAVTGTLSFSQGGSVSDATGTLTGTLDTSTTQPTLKYTVTYAYGFNCQGTFTGTATMNNADLIGAYQGQNCVRPFTGALHVTRSDSSSIGR